LYCLIIDKNERRDEQYCRIGFVSLLWNINFLGEISIKRQHASAFFPWRCNNDFELLIDGEQFYSEILQSMALAQRYILIEMYLVESGEITDKFISVLCAKAQQGIVIKLLFDDYGANKLINYDRQRLKAAGVTLVFYNPIRLARWKCNLHRTHRKIIVIDGVIAFTGGAGIADHFIGKQAWRETMIKITGEVVADWQQLFLNNFQSSSLTKQSPLPISSASLIHSKQNKPNKNQRSLARVICSKGGTRIALKHSLLKHIMCSQQTVWLATAYFIPSWKIRRALRHAVQQGKDVRLLLPGIITDHPSVVYAGRRYYAALLRHGVRIYEYQGRFMHTKVVLIDDWVSMGSSNMDRWNLLWNLEANQEIKEVAFAQHIKAMLQNDFRHSNEIIFAQWIQRSRFARLREGLWGKIDVWLSSWKNNLK
jgi:phosphatidylserine/phosphatidylglycerophosphate/cardiolipin synthase-like enzyme